HLLDGDRQPAWDLRARPHHGRPAVPRRLPPRGRPDPPAPRPPPPGLPPRAFFGTGRPRAPCRWTPLPGQALPIWICTWLKVQFERFPTNWGLPRAQVLESTCAAHGADACRWEVRWKTPSRGRRFWVPSLTGGAAALVLGAAAHGAGGGWPFLAAGAVLLAGVVLGYALREGHERRHTQRLLDLQSEEIIYSNRELEKKFVELETRIEQLSLLTDLSAAVSGTLDPEKIYDQALSRLVHRMPYERAYLLLVDRERRVLRGHRSA